MTNDRVQYDRVRYDKVQYGMINQMKANRPFVLVQRMQMILAYKLSETMQRIRWAITNAR